MRYISLCIILILLAGCMSGYEQFYYPNPDPESKNNLEMLKKGEEPSVYFSDNQDRDVKNLISKNYVPIGMSSFNGAYEDENKIKAQARKIGATVALYNCSYTNTQTKLQKDIRCLKY